MIKWNMASFMGRINYNYLGRYLLTVSARYDGSSRLADGHKWVLFLLPHWHGVSMKNLSCRVHPDGWIT